MIRSVSIQHFRALRDVTVNLRPLTVLVGVNDSGKTSFLRAINHPGGGFSTEDYWRGAAGPTIGRCIRSPYDGASFNGTVEMFQLPSAGVQMETDGVAEVDGSTAPSLAGTGENLAAVLDYLLRTDRRRFDRVQEQLKELVKGLEQVKIRTPAPSRRALSLLIEGGLEIKGHQLSTGARMLFFFVSLAHHPSPPDVVLIEEPENGVHPKRLGDIVGLLRSLTEGKLSGKPVQVVLTTHSPYLLDHIRLPEDQVLVFRREEDGRRTASEVDEQGLKSFLDEFMLGEVWFNQGEEGLLASRR